MAKLNLLLWLLALSACYRAPAVVFAPASPGQTPLTPLFRDAFERADTPPGSLGIAPDGLPYQLSGAGLPTARVSNHQYISTGAGGPTYASKYFTGRALWGVSITFQFTQSPSQISGLALITSTDSSAILLTNMNHWVFTGTGRTSASIWYRGKQNLPPGYVSTAKIQTYQMGVAYTISLTMDGNWVYCQLPDGSFETISLSESNSAPNEPLVSPAQIDCVLSPVKLTGWLKLNGVWR